MATPVFLPTQPADDIFGVNREEKMSDPSNGFDFGYKDSKPQQPSSPYVQPIPPSQQRPTTPAAQPPRQQAYYQQPQVYTPVPQQKSRTLAVVLIVIGSVVVLPVVIFIVIIAMMLGGAASYTTDPYTPPTSGSDSSTPGTVSHNYEATSDYYWDMVRNPYTGGDNAAEGVDNTTVPVGAMDAFISGEFWLPAPDGEEPVEAFSDSYADVNEFFQSSLSGGDNGVKVVVTSDPAYNCGMSTVTVNKKTVAGCYNPAYGNVLFIWWAEESPQDMRLLTLFHVYSHYVQTFDSFDTMYAAYKSPEADQGELRRIIEQDSTCRVYYSWGNDDFEFYDRSLANPCAGVGSDWDEYWMRWELEDIGVGV